MLPVEAQITALAPSRTAAETAQVMPRSLNEPVGLAPSSFRRTDRADHLREHGRAQQRRGALLQADQLVAGRERQALVVALDQRHVRARESRSFDSRQRHGTLALERGERRLMLGTIRLM